MAELLEAAEVRILRLQPGDEIILTVERAGGPDDLRNLKRAAEERWPGHRVTVLHDTVSMEIVRETSNQDSDRQESNRAPS